MDTPNPIPTALTSMLIRKPVSDVFQAIVDPSITTKIWYTHSSGPMTPGANLEWEWRMYGAKALVNVIELEENKWIKITWGDEGNLSTVTWEFMEVKGDNTYVTIKNFDFKETGDALHAAISDSTGGFTWLLASMKAYFEHGVLLNAVDDKWPPEMR